MKRVFLIGYMGSGKTTLGKAYSAATGLQFVDLDWYIEERMHKSISDLFAERGEDGFRLLEQKMLHEAGEFENVLIACGGGTPCFFDNMDYMNHTGETGISGCMSGSTVPSFKDSKGQTSAVGE